MNILKQCIEKVNQLFDEESLSKLAKKVGFKKRKRKISAKNFLEKLLINQTQVPDISLQELANEISGEGKELKKQSLHQKFNSSGKEFFRNVLERGLEKMTKELSCLKGIEFIQSIKVCDSTEISLPECFRKTYPMTQGRGAAIKIQACIEIMRGSIEGLEIRPAREPDQGYEGILDYVEENSLWIGDLGYFSIERFEKIQEVGGFFLSKLFGGAKIYDAQNETAIELRKILKGNKKSSIEIKIKLGKQKLACRCIAIRLNQESYEKRMRNFDKKQRRRSIKIGNKEDIENLRKKMQIAAQ